MRPTRTITLFMILILAAAGCRFGPDLMIAPETSQSDSGRIKDPELAKLILTPKREKLQVARDPFKPLMTKSGSTVTTGTAPRAQVNVQYLGTLKVGDQTKALLRVNGKKGFYLKGDDVQGYTIENIDTDQLTLSQGDQQLQIKRSDDK